jgi:hypothetical protein
MKRILILIISCLPFFLTAQNYQNICSPGITFFKDSVNYLQAFRRDSANLMPNGDTLFISYRTIRDTAVWTCADTTQGSVLGRKIIRTGTGWFYFFNRNNDTLKLKTQAVLNESWKFCQLAGGSYVQASVTSILNDTVFGQPDQVKVITFQAKNSSNVNIPNFLNQQTILLSKHYGLTRFLEVFSLPDHVYIFELAGKSNPPMGIQDFGWRDVYNFDVGDVFHYTGNASGSGGSANWKKIVTVLDKTVFGNMDSVQYIFQQCKVMNSGPPPTTTSSFDTVSTMYNFLTMNTTNFMLGLPMEFIPKGGVYADLITAFSGWPNNRFSKEFMPNWYDTWVNPGCWVPPFEPAFDRTNYTPDLGCTFYETGWMTWQSIEYLVYYKKGTEVWGTPVSTDCHSLVSVSPAPEKSPLRVIISPNPVSQSSIITILGCQGTKEFDFTLFNNLGREVFNLKSENPSFSFDRKDLPNGLYIYVVNGTGINQRGKLIIK